MESPNPSSTPEQAPELTIAVTDKIVQERCPECAIPFGVTEYFQRLRERDGDDFYCPLGHRQSYDGETDWKEQYGRARKVLDEKNAQISVEHAALMAERASHKATVEAVAGRGRWRLLWMALRGLVRRTDPNKPTSQSTSV